MSILQHRQAPTGHHLPGLHSSILQSWQQHAIEPIAFAPGSLRIHAINDERSYKVTERHNTTYHIIDERTGIELKVPVENIYEYVSPLHLEVFENQRFEHERHLEELRATDDEASSSPSAASIHNGRYGRPRPSYAKHLVPPAELAQARRSRDATAPPRLKPNIELPDGDEIVVHRRATAKTSMSLPEGTEQASEDAISPSESDGAYELAAAAMTEPEDHEQPLAPAKSAGAVSVIADYDGDHHWHADDEQPSEDGASQEESGGVSQRRNGLALQLGVDEQLSDHAVSTSDAQELELVDAIVGHSLSDPARHPPGYGTNPIMLYHIRWADQSESWEPADSFDDRTPIEAYHKRLSVNIALDR